MKKYLVGDIVEAERKPVKEKPNSWTSTSTDENTSQRFVYIFLSQHTYIII